MNWKLCRNDMLRESQKAKGQNVFLECLILLGMFLLLELVVMLGTMPFFGIMFCFMHPLQNYGMVHGQAALSSLVNNLSMIISLFLQILTIFGTILFCKLTQKRKAWTLGFKKGPWLKEYGTGLLVGFAMLSIAYFLAVLTGSVTARYNDALFEGANPLFFLLFFLGFLIQGMAEEVMFRGYFMISLARRKGNLWMAVLVSGFFFALAHMLNPGLSPLAFLNLMLFGIFAALYFLKRGNIWGVGALHSMWNFTQGNIWGISVSGMEMGPSLMKSVPDAGMAFLNGGDFGLEGGIFTTLVLVGGILVLMKLTQKDTVPEEDPEEVPVTESVSADHL